MQTRPVVSIDAKSANTQAPVKDSDISLSMLLSSSHSDKIVSCRADDRRDGREFFCAVLHVFFIGKHRNDARLAVMNVPPFHESFRVAR